MMKIVTFFAAAVAAASASVELDMPMEIKADSPLGMRLLSEASQNEDRMLSDWKNTWISGYSLKFEGCHQISQWNSNADGDEDVRIITKRLVKFKLCPSDSCDVNKGCVGGYGDYIIDMESYIAAWFESKQAYQSFKCDYLATTVCQCADSTDSDGGTCAYDCFAGHKMLTTCMSDAYDDGAFNLYNYMSCAALSDNLYVGPYCASQGGAIYLGAFTDDTCTTFADSAGGRESYYAYKGSNLPYGQTNIIDMDCMSCKEPSENNVDGDDADDSDDVAEFCEEIYTPSGKCEAKLPYGTSMVPNNNACTYLTGIKAVRADGTIMTAEARANKTAAVFIGMFTVLFVLLSSYVYFLKTKLDRASINLAE